MRIARVRVNGKSSTAVIRGRSAHLVRGGPFGGLEPTGERAPLSKVQFLVPVQPTKIVAMAVNYRSHAGDRAASPKPEAFLKAPSSLIAHGEPIVIPHGTANVHEEAEVVVVIGRRAKECRRGGRRPSHLRLHVRQRRLCARLAARRHAVVARQVG